MSPGPSRISPRRRLEKSSCLSSLIQPDERLAVTLRYLATRGTYHSLEYSIRISRQTISSIVSDTSRGLQLETRLLRPLRPPCFFFNLPGSRASLTANHKR